MLFHLRYLLSPVPLLVNSGHASVFDPLSVNPGHAYAFDPLSVNRRAILR